MNRITTILLLALVLVSCSKDNEGVINVGLEGKWTLTNASCFCGFDQNSDFSVHKITFTGSNLTVENSADPKFLTDASGSYSVEGNLISLSNSAQFRYMIDGSDLTLTFVDNLQIADDELVLQYGRN